MFNFFERKKEEKKPLKSSSSEQKKTKKEEYIKSVMNKTGWSYDFAAEKIKAARKNVGISYRDYDRFDFYNVPEEKQEEEYKKVLARKERLKTQKENNIKSVMNKTGWSYDFAVEKIKAARKNVGISYKDYDRFNFYNVPEERQAAEYQLVLAKKERLKIQKERNLASVMNNTGWDREYAMSQIEDAKKRLGITLKDYSKYEFFNIPLAKQKKTYENILKEKEEIRQQERESVIKKVMEETGWDRDFTVRKIMDARKRTGCKYKEYMIYKFYEMDDAVQEEFFLIRESKKLRLKYDVNIEFIDMLRNKELTNNYFSEFLKRPWCVNTKVSLDEFIKKFSDSKRIIYKPIDGHRGFGVEDFYINHNNAEEIFRQLEVLPDGVVEEYVVQHHDVNSLAPSSVNTLRIVTISSNTQQVTSDGKYFDVAYAALRLGGGTSIVDNFHSGGMVAAVDLETGELVTDAADMEGNVFKVHPSTGKPIKGFKIPYFAEAMELVNEACRKNKIEGYLGWDIAITETGPVLIELNTAPGVVLLSMPYVAEKKGKKYIMEKYL